MQSRVVVFSIFFAFLSAGSAQAAGGFFDKLKKSVSGDYTVRGRVPLNDGQWLTCFASNNTGYLGPRTLARPGDAQLDPATGSLKVSTAAIPTIILTSGGIVTSNDCDSLAKQGLLVADSASAPAAGARADTGYTDSWGCTDPSWTSDEIVRRKDEIMECQAEAIGDRAYARSRARQQAAQSQSDGVAVQGTPAVGAGEAERQAALAKLQQDTADKFKAIQAQGATPAAAPAQSDEDLAWDGAKLCGLKPAYLMKVREEAVRFVRIDEASDRIILSEMAGGTRNDVAVDGNSFAQRVSFNAQAIGQGGDTCARGFWNAEAYKAATAAMSGG